jgi:hypothetical protein
MRHPDWYPDWRHDAVHQLEEKNARLKSEFRLGEWQRYDYDIDKGEIVFSDQGAPRVIAQIQIAGTTSSKAGNWLWAWANSHWPAERVTDSKIVRAYGEKHGICDLTHESVEDKESLNVLGWELTSVMARITNALGAYRPPRGEGGGLYLIYKSVVWAN